MVHKEAALPQSVTRPAAEMPCYLFQRGGHSLVIDPCAAAEAHLPAQSEDIVVTAARRSLVHTPLVEALRMQGARVWASWQERYYLEGGERYWTSRKTFNLFDTRLDREAPIQPIRVDSILHDFASYEFCDTEFRILPVPFAKYGAIALQAIIDGRNALFAGDLFLKGGTIRQAAAAQYVLNDARGLINLYNVAEDLLELDLDLIFPSFGPLITDPKHDLTRLRERIEAYLEMLEGDTTALERGRERPFVEVGSGVYYASYTEARTHFLLSTSGKVVTLDYGN